MLKRIWDVVSGKARRDGARRRAERLRLQSEAEAERERAKREREEKAKFFRLRYTPFVAQDLPFWPGEYEFVYLCDDDVEYADGEAFVRDNLAELQRCFAEHGYRFVYLKTVAAEVAADEQMRRYYLPDGRAVEVGEAKELSNGFLLDFMKTPANRPKLKSPAIACFNAMASHYIPEENYVRDGNFVFDRIEFDFRQVGDIAAFVLSFLDYWRATRAHGGFFALKHPKDADEGFDIETHRLLEEVAERVDKLRRRGVSEMVLQQYIGTTLTKESRLTITADYRLILNDYDNREVTMTPLVKAVFLLFLRHPEGILFKELVDYRDELAMLYDCVKSKKPIPAKIHVLHQHEQSIVALTDPLDNSINEKCTRIKEAFLLQVHDYIASHYYVVGKRGEPKRIILEPDNVVWPGGDEKDN